LAENRSGLLFVIAAPSGAGKTSLCRALMGRLREEGERPLEWSCSYTTRKPREGEVHGRDYFFVDDAGFDRMVKAGEFAEWAWVHDRRYGTSAANLKKAEEEGVDLLVEIDIQGAAQLRKKYELGCFIFILPPSWEALVARLQGRGTEPAEEVAKRLQRAKAEMLEWTWFDYIIINDRFEEAVDRLRAVALGVRSRREAMKPLVQKILRGFEQEG